MTAAVRPTRHVVARAAQARIIEQSIVKGTMREFTDAEMAEYRRPFLEPGEGRRPMLTWPRQLPIGGEPADVSRIEQRSLLGI